MEFAGTVFTLLWVLVISQADPVSKQKLPIPLPNTRRIINGKEVGDTRPYMVYLRPSPQTDKSFVKSNWLCGGVIIHPRYILTSAACIEDVKNFYVVAGTNEWTPANEETECIKNGAKKAVWKCVPKDYYFDGAEFDNIHWMSGDIAVVKVEDEFNFNKRVVGCNYIPQMINFNNISQDIAKPGIMGSVAGWGSAMKFSDLDLGKGAENSLNLSESDVQIISKESCKNSWEERYHSIIEESMICTKDDQDVAQMSQMCLEQGINCTEIRFSAEQEDGPGQFRAKDLRKSRKLKGNGHQYNLNRRHEKIDSGGFCENDHGGPLIVGHGTTAIVVGVISASLTKPITRKCNGPYLYTSIWNYRNLISCAIDKDIGSTETCRKAFGELKASKNQISEVSFDWKNQQHSSKGFVNQQLSTSKVLPLELLK